MTASARVTRGLNDTRVAVLFVLLGMGATVGSTAGFAEHSAPVGLLWAAGAVGAGVIVLALIYRWPWLRAKTMAGMHWITKK